MEYIVKDQHEYTLDDEDRKVEEVIMNPDPSNTDAAVLRNSLSFSYPDLPFNDVIKKENEMLHLELQYPQSYFDVGQCELIQNLMEITEVFASNYQCEKDMEYVTTNEDHQDDNGLQMVVYSAPGLVDLHNL